MHEFLRRTPTGGWLAPAQTAELLGCYGIALRPGATDGAEVAVGAVQDPVFGPAVQDPVFGPLVTFGPVGAVAGHAVRLAPLTGTDADGLLRDVPWAPPLPGGTDRPAAGLAVLRDTLLCVSRLTADLPEIAELHLGPVTVGAASTAAAAARIRLAPCLATGPFLRKR